MLEKNFQSRLIKRIKQTYNECIIIKTDPTYLQGLPDLIIFCNDKWAALECKNSKNAKHQPNQDYYVQKMNDMSFASFVYPENEEQVLSELELYFYPLNWNPDDYI